MSRGFPLQVFALGVIAAWLVLSTAGAAAPDSGVGRDSEYVSSTWRTEDGLPQLTVKKIAQTRQGFLWVGTWNGFARFDGTQFKPYTLGNTPHLTSDNVSALFEDRNGHLWLGTHDDGVIRFADGRFLHFGAADGLRELRVRAIGQDRDGTMWVGATFGLFRQTGERFEEVPLAGLLPSDYIADIQNGPAGRLWVAAREGLLIFENGRLAAEPIRSEQPIKALRFDAEGRPWVVTQNLRFGLGVGDRVEMRELPETLRPTALAADRQGTLLLGTSDGAVFRVRTREGQVTAMRPVRSADGHAIMDIYEDAQGSVWVGVEAGGLVRLRERQVRTLTIADGLVNTALASVSEGDEPDTVWAATFGQLHHWREGRFEPVAFAPESKAVTTVLRTRDGTIWCGMYFDRLHCRERGGEWLTNISESIGFRSLFEDRDGALWIGTRQNGAECWRDGRLQRWSVTDGLSHNDVYCFARDRGGATWIGTASGLNRLHDGKITVFRRADGIGSDQIRALFADHEGTLWVGSVGGGLARWRGDGFRRITTREGLRSDWVEQILEDDDGNLWLGTGAGIMRIALDDLNRCADGKISYLHGTVFGREEGMIVPNCGSGYQPSAVKTRDGRLWFATGGGLAVIDPRTVRRDDSPPPVYLESVVLDGNTVDGTDEPGYAGGGTPFRVPPGTSRIEFHYTGLSLVAPRRMRFRYQLEGYDADWVEAGIERVAHYTRIPPGRYRFRVTAANSDGFWNKEGAAMAVVVSPAWWQTAWFAALAIVTFAGSIGGAARLVTVRRYRRRMAELERQHTLERERTRIARDMHDGLGSDLVKISLLGEIAEGQMDDSESLRPRLQKISRTAREAVRGMDEIVWAVNPRNDTVENLANYLCQFAREHFEATSTRLHLDIPPNLPNHPLSAEVRHNLFLVIKEALNNIVKHAHAGDAWLRLRVDENRLEISVEDNGRGMESDPAPGRKGHGLENLQVRTSQIGARLEVQSRQQNGTRITIELKLS